MKIVVLALLCAVSCLASEVLVLPQMEPPPIGAAAATFRPNVMVIITEADPSIVAYRVVLSADNLPTAETRIVARKSEGATTTVWYRGILSNARVRVLPLAAGGAEVIR